MSKGFASLLILLVVALIATVGFSVIVVRNEDTEEPAERSISEDSSTPIPSSTTGPVFSISPTVVPSVNPVPTSTCGIVTSVSGSNPLAVNLAYSVTPVNNSYMTGAQWDFDGNGSWDTDLSQSNGSTTHTYPTSGTYKVKLRLQMSDGTFTNTCSKSVTVPQGFEVSLKGKIFEDVNCNNTWDPGEGYLSGVTVNFFKVPEYSLYKTLTTDSGGNFNLSVLLNSGDSVTLNPAPIALWGYKIRFQVPSYTLNSSSPNASTAISMVPASNIGSCPKP
ncbi:MAG: PKD domain-containing protein [Patescibacteria group bacterium]